MNMIKLLLVPAVRIKRDACSVRAHTHTHYESKTDVSIKWVNSFTSTPNSHTLYTSRCFYDSEQKRKNYVENYANIHRTENEMTTWTQYECESQKKCEIILLYHLQAINTIEV